MRAVMKHAEAIMPRRAFRKYKKCCPLLISFSSGFPLIRSGNADVRFQNDGRENAGFVAFFDKICPGFVLLGRIKKGR